jgi:hypothetical protein
MVCASGKDLEAALRGARDIYERHGVPWGMWHCDLTESLAAGQPPAGLADRAVDAGLLTEAEWLRTTASPADHPLLFL